MLLEALNRPSDPRTKVLLIHLSTRGPERQTPVYVHQETIFPKLNPRGQRFTRERSELGIPMLFLLVSKQMFWQKDSPAFLLKKFGEVATETNAAHRDEQELSPLQMSH